MSDVAQKVLEETKRFYAALPELLKAHRDQWVVFLDGAVKSEHASEDVAYAAAVKQFGKDGGFVVGKVIEVSPVPVTARMMFGIA